MTTQEQHIAQKKKEIEKITRQQDRLIKIIVAIPTRPSKRKYINFLRLAKRFDIAQQINSLELQKQIIIARPMPKVEGQHPGGLAIVGESGPEVIAAGNFKIYPTSFVKPDTVLVISEGGIIDERVFKALKK